MQWRVRSSPLLLIAWTVAALCLLLALAHGVAMIRFPLQIDYAEGAVLQLTEALAHGRGLYRDPQQYPWQVSPYTPLFMGAAALLLDPCGGGFASGRLLALVCALLCAALVARAASRRGGRVAGWSALTVFAVSPLFVGWAALDRVDFMPLTFELAALGVVDGLLACEPRRPRLAAVAAGLLFALAFWSKQSYALGFMAAVAVLLARGACGRAMAIAAVTGLGIAIPFAVLDRASGGHMLDLVFRFNAMPWDAHRTWLWVSGYAQTVPLALPVAALAAIALRRRAPLWGVYFALTLLTLVGAGRVGAYYNHFLPLHAAAAILCGLGTAAALPGHRWLVGAVLLAQVVMGFFAGLAPTIDAPSFVLVHELPAALDGRILARIRQADQGVEDARALLTRYPGPILAENLGLPVLVGRPAMACDPITLFTLAEMGRWKEDELQAMLRERCVAVVLLQELSERNPRFPPRILSLIQANYTPRFRLGGDYVLLPRTKENRR